MKPAPPEMGVGEEEEWGPANARAWWGRMLIPCGEIPRLRFAVLGMTFGLNGYGEAGRKGVPPAFVGERRLWVFGFALGFGV